jgi:hypothetical protein
MKAYSFICQLFYRCSIGDEEFTFTNPTTILRQNGHEGGFFSCFVKFRAHGKHNACSHPEKAT